MSTAHGTKQAGPTPLLDFLEKAGDYVMRAWGWRRVGLVVQSVWVLSLGWGYWETRSEDLLVPLFWPLLFCIAAVLYIVLAIKPGNRNIYAAIGVIVILGFLSRPLNTLLNWMIGKTPDAASILVSVDIMIPLAALYATFWFRLVGQWNLRHEAGEPRKGD